MRRGFWDRGYALVHAFLPEEDCRRHEEAVRELGRRVELPLIVRESGGRSLRYRVVDGRNIEAALPQIGEIGDRVARLLQTLCGVTLEPISDSVAARNINVTPPGGEYRWHYDRNTVTAILYLNEVEGGETELFANYRLLFRGGRHLRIQRVLDAMVRPALIRSMAGRRRLVSPRRGSLLVMRGDRALHSVRRVGGDQDRINLVLAFDLPGVVHSRQGLNRYLYEDAAVAVAGDPNYAA